MNGKFLSIIMLAGLLAGCTQSTRAGLQELRMTIYKPKSCGCCGLYADYVRKQGVEVKVVEASDGTKGRLGVPPGVQSCHTSVIGGYFVEGHVPIEAVEKLIAEKPDIAGIAMTGMPAGSPGMPGTKREPFVIYAVGRDGSLSEFMKI